MYFDLFIGIFLDILHCSLCVLEALLFQVFIDVICIVRILQEVLFWFYLFWSLHFMYVYEYIYIHTDLLINNVYVFIFLYLFFLAIVMCI